MKLGKKLMAAVLAAVMTVSVASVQAMAAQPGADGTAPAVAAAAEKSDLARSNSLGLGANCNNLVSWQVGDTDEAQVYLNTYSGNMTYTNLLFEDNMYPEMELRLTYNSQTRDPLGFGPGFQTNFNMRILDSGDYVTFIDQTGTEIIFRGERTAVGGVEYTLSKTDAGHCIWTQNKEYFFDGRGRLVQIMGGGLAHSYTIDIAYNENGLLESVTPHYMDQGTRRIEFGYSTIPGSDIPVIYGIYCYDEADTRPSNSIYLGYNERGMESIYVQHRAEVEIRYDMEYPSVSRIGDYMNAYTQVGYTVGTGLIQATQLELPNGESYQYLYGNNQTLITTPNGDMSLRNFDDDGVWINP